MNYITEINRFYDWLETNDIPKSAVALWYALMHVNNKSDWKSSFEVAISTLEFKTKFRRSELFEARNILTQKGRISWRPRGGNLSATYEIIPFCIRIADTTTDAKAYSERTQMGTQTGTINKLNYTKQDLFIKAGTETIIFNDLAELFEVDTGLMMRWLNNGLPRENFQDGVKLWMQRHHGQDYKDFKEARQHFYNWVPFYIDESKKKELNEPIKRTITSKPAGGKQSAGALELLGDLKDELGI